MSNIITVKMEVREPQEPINFLEHRQNVAKFVALLMEYSISFTLDSSKVEYVMFCLSGYDAVVTRSLYDWVQEFARLTIQLGSQVQITKE